MQGLRQPGRRPKRAEILADPPATLLKTGGTRVTERDPNQGKTRLLTDSEKNSGSWKVEPGKFYTHIREAPRKKKGV